jgi:hypothetical protein
MPVPAEWIEHRRGSDRELLGCHGDSDRWLQARIVEVSTESIRVKKEDGGAIDAPAVEYVLPFPAGARLRLRSGELELPDFGRRLG